MIFIKSHTHLRSELTLLSEIHPVTDWQAICTMPFMTVLFAVAEQWKQFKCPEHGHTMEYYSVPKQHKQEPPLWHRG